MPTNNFRNLFTVTTLSRIVSAGNACADPLVADRLGGPAEGGEAGAQLPNRRLSGVRIPGSGGKTRACSAYPSVEISIELVMHSLGAGRLVDLQHLGSQSRGLNHIANLER
jgi:hypothetical protein